jgi:lipid-A-disaccharide synthase
MMQTPFVMVYCVSSLTYLLGKPRVKVPHYAMVNLIAGEQVVPELVQHDFTAANVVARLQEILPDGPSRSRMLDDLVKVKARLRAPESAVEGLSKLRQTAPPRLFCRSEIGGSPTSSQMSNSCIRYG